jgi:hypothetical protein
VAVSELNETRERISVMESHLASVVTEQQHTQRLVEAKVKEIETEDHLKQLAERERGRFAAELKKLQRESASHLPHARSVPNTHASHRRACLPCPAPVPCSPGSRLRTAFTHPSFAQAPSWLTSDGQPGPDLPRQQEEGSFAPSTAHPRTLHPSPSPM